MYQFRYGDVKRFCAIQSCIEIRSSADCRALRSAPRSMGIVNSPVARNSAIRSWKRTVIFAIAVGRGDFRLDAFLPAAVKIQPLLRSEAQAALVPFAVLEHAQLFEQLAHQGGARVGNRHVVRGPGIRGDLVLTPARISAGLGFHFKQHEIAKAAFVQTPRRAQSGDAAADDDDGKFFGARRRFENDAWSRMRCPVGNASLTNPPAMRRSAFAVRPTSAALRNPRRL